MLVSKEQLGAYFKSKNWGLDSTLCSEQGWVNMGLFLI